ncbi:hypothetical protein BN3658_01232 [Coriobacteriaceae bacterium CHKCI002]|nr:hypothetical protein BN3658_01232 [Coriobacteriaceae bacterium CHKCI002]
MKRTFLMKRMPPMLDDARSAFRGFARIADGRLVPCRKNVKERL